MFLTFDTAPNPGNVRGVYWRESWKEKRPYSVSFGVNWWSIRAVTWSLSSLLDRLSM